jgi:hypothetical protein
MLPANRRGGFNCRTAPTTFDCPVSSLTVVLGCAQVSQRRQLHHIVTHSVAPTQSVHQTSSDSTSDAPLFQALSHTTSQALGPHLLLLPSASTTTPALQKSICSASQPWVGHRPSFAPACPRAAHAQEGAQRAPSWVSAWVCVHSAGTCASSSLSKHQENSIRSPL